MANGGLVLYPNTVDYAMRLSDADSETNALLHALSDARFCGVDFDVARNGLSDINTLAFDMIMDRVQVDMLAYKNRCEQNRANAKARTSKSNVSKNDACQAQNNSNVVGGGMVLHDDSLELLIDLAGKETEQGKFLYALYRVRFEGSDPKAEKAALPKRAAMVFTMSIKRVMEDMQAYQNRCEQNRRNASKRKTTKKIRTQKVADTREPAASVVLPNLPEDTADVGITSVLSADNAPDDMTAMLAELEQIAEPFDAESETEPACETDGSTKITTEVVNTEKENDGLPSLAVACNKNKNINKNYNTPSYIPPVSQEVNSGDVRISELQSWFDDLYSLYPKKEEPNAAWQAFLQLNPDEELIKKMQTGLHMALQKDRRFHGEYRYIPLLSNWIRREGWLDENIHLVQNPYALHTGESVSHIVQGQHPVWHRTKINPHEMAIRAIQEMKEKYGDGR